MQLLGKGYWEVFFKYFIENFWQDSLVNLLLPLATRYLKMLPNNTFMLISIINKWMYEDWCTYNSCDAHRPGDLCYNDLTLTVNFSTLIPDCDVHNLLFFDLYLTSNPNICSSVSLPPLVHMFLVDFLLLDLFKNWDSLHARLNSYCKVWSYKKKKHKKIKAYRESV